MDNKETSNITVGYYHTLEDKQITISLEEYKELLIIKGKYEEATKPKFEPYTATSINTYKSSSEGKHLLNG